MQPSPQPLRSFMLISLFKSRTLAGSFHGPACGMALHARKRLFHSSADDPDFLSIADRPPELIRAGRKHGPGLILLAMIPITAFGLGTWQIFRLEWKTELMAKSEDQLIRPPLPLPPHIDQSAIEDFYYRRIYCTGRFRHEQEMLVGPRIRDGKNGYLVFTPLERQSDASTILVNRGWIAKELRRQPDRKDGLPLGQITIQGLLREPWKKNMFTPNNRPELGEFYFPDIHEMAKLTDSEPVWVEETMDQDLLAAYEREAKGIPISGPAQHNRIPKSPAPKLTTRSRYSLSIATSIMFWMLVKKPPSEVTRRVRLSREW
ncbi:MAG: hypothetical protein Q9167_005294 [Letrouitia subvulpina]